MTHTFDKINQTLDADMNEKKAVVQWKLVPPAGDVEVLAWYLPDEDGKPDATVRWDIAKHVPEAFPLVDRAHVTKLQAENEVLRKKLRELVSSHDR